MTENKTFECPKCGSKNSSNSLECGHCGIIIKKYQKFIDKREINRRNSLIACKVCQKEISKNASTCPHCGEPCANNSRNYPHSEIHYASLWKRCIAFTIDMIILFVGTVVIVVVNGQPPEAAMGSLIGSMFLYYLLMEISPLQGTLGKMLLRIKVTDMEGNRIGFGAALAHSFARFFSNLLLGFGYVMAFFTQKKQSLHDMAAKCIVVDK